MLAGVRPILALKCLLHSIQESADPDSYDGGVHWPLRRHAYSNVLKILQPKKENFQLKNSDIFHISAQNIACGYALEPSTHNL